MPASDRRLDGLDALRGVAALAVCFFHWEQIIFSVPAEQQIFRLGLLGVELFFMISGAVILMVAERGSSPSDFVASRAVRLYPAYIVAVGLTAIYVLAVHKYDVTTVLINFTMLQSFIAVPNITNPFWTLAFEIVFYLYVAALIRAQHLRHLEWYCLAWLGIGLIYRLMLPGGMTLDESNPAKHILFILLAPQFAPFFILGLMIWRWRSRRASRLSYVVLISALAITCFGRGDFAQIHGAIYFTLTAVMVGALMASLRINVAIPWPITFLGLISYPLYLIHCTISNLGNLIASRLDLASIPIGLIFATLTFVIAASIHVYIERPIQAWFRERRAASARTVLTN
jgi:peptidoglycan/LPS O-acetylase OafA/YrhL